MNEVSRSDHVSGETTRLVCPNQELAEGVVRPGKTKERVMDHVCRAA